MKKLFTNPMDHALPKNASKELFDFLVEYKSVIRHQLEKRFAWISTAYETIHVLSQQEITDETKRKMKTTLAVMEKDIAGFPKFIEDLETYANTFAFDHLNGDEEHKNTAKRDFKISKESDIFQFNEGVNALVHEINAKALPIIQAENTAKVVVKPTVLAQQQPVLAKGYYQSTQVFFNKPLNGVTGVTIYPTNPGSTFNRK